MGSDVQSIEDSSQIIHATSASAFQADLIFIMIETLDKIERAPPNLEDLWRAINSTEGAQSTPGIFYFQGGFKPWLAYICLTDDTIIRDIFPCRDDIGRLLNDLENSPVARRKYIATLVNAASTRPGSAVGRESPAELIIRDLQMRVLPTNGRSLQQDQSSTVDVQGYPSVPASSPPNYHTNKRRRTDGLPSTTNPTVIPTSSNAAQPRPQAAAAPTPTLVPANAPTTSRPSMNFMPMENLKALLPKDLKEAIAVHPDPKDADNILAYVSLVYLGTSGCTLRLRIDQEKVSYLAMLLFKVRVETMQDARRYIYLGDGVKVVGQPTLVLQGAPCELITRVFGPEVSSAIYESPTYITEARLGSDTTACISMEIPRLATDLAAIVIWIGLQNGTELGRLFSYTAPS